MRTPWIVAVLCLSSALTAAPSHAGTQVVAYMPGAAVASKPVYDASGSYTFKCTFSGWAATPTKSWGCVMFDGHSGAELVPKTGTFTGSYYYTAVYFVPKAIGQFLCTKADAHYIGYGGASATSTVCN